MGKGRCFAVSREKGLGKIAAGANGVDTFKDAPVEMKQFSAMNPFHFSPDKKIPVPGQVGLFACSVESVWQGLKQVGGKTAFEMFSLPPWKRPPDNERYLNYDYESSVFLYGDKTIDLLTARYLIYLPAYLHTLNCFVPKHVFDYIYIILNKGEDIYFYDWDHNMNLQDTTSSFSHSAILAAVFNCELKELFLNNMYACGNQKKSEGLMVDLPAPGFFKNRLLC